MSFDNNNTAVCIYIAFFPRLKTLYNTLWGTQPDCSLQAQIAATQFTRPPRRELVPSLFDDDNVPHICLLSLSEKTRKSNHLQMSLQRKNFLLKLFKDPECFFPAWQSGTLPTEPTGRRLILQFLFLSPFVLFSFFRCTILLPTPCS